MPMDGDDMGTANENAMNETEIHEFFMDKALQQARAASDMGEVPIGAIVVEQSSPTEFRILSEAYNLVENKYDASAHAEMLALKLAAKKCSNWRLPNATLYTTLEPCPMCLAAIQAFRVSKIVYAAPDIRLGAITSHIQLLDVKHPFHTVDQVVSGVHQNQSATMMRSFFRERRKQSKEQRKKRKEAELKG